MAEDLISHNSVFTLNNQASSPTSMSLLFNLNSSIETYQTSLNSFATHIKEKLAEDKSIKCKCSQLLSSSLSDLKTTFNDFAEEWKV